jgi:hypothetical protein
MSKEIFKMKGKVEDWTGLRKNPYSPLYVDEYIIGTAFYGGSKKGKCLQLTTNCTTEQGYIQLTRSQAIRLAKKILQEFE